MKHGILAALTLATLAFSALAPAEPVPIKKLPTPCDRNPALCKRLPLKPLCTDPAATEIAFRIISRETRFKGRVEIKATVKNLGSPYVTAPNQQLINLYEISPGNRNGKRLVASKAFGNLATGETTTVTFERTWESASPAEGEFPPSYRAELSYDPDILLDGNTRNDDCHKENNAVERSGSGINALFSAP